MRQIPFLLALLFLPSPALTRAEEEAEKEEVAPAPARPKIDPDPVVEEVDDEKAEKMLAELETAVDSEDENTIVNALAPFITASHETFYKDLSKLAKNRYVSIRIAATKALGSQKEPAKKIGPLLFSLLTSKVNEDSPVLLGVTIDSMRRQKFDRKPVIKEMESLFRKQKDPEVMREAARFLGAVKHLEAVPMLVGWVEAPQPGNVHSGSNPPASYWKAMWDIWDQIKVHVAHALKEMTGKEFETEKEWREWLSTREAKELGIR